MRRNQTRSIMSCSGISRPLLLLLLGLLGCAPATIGSPPIIAAYSTGGIVPLVTRIDAYPEQRLVLLSSSYCGKKQLHLSRPDMEQLTALLEMLAELDLPSTEEQDDPEAAGFYLAIFGHEISGLRGPADSQVSSLLSKVSSLIGEEAGRYPVFGQTNAAALRFTKQRQ